MAKTQGRNQDGWLPTWGRSITAATLARRVGLQRKTVDAYCRAGRFRGAWFDPLTWQWWIPLPVVARG